MSLLWGISPPQVVRGPVHTSQKRCTSSDSGFLQGIECVHSLEDYGQTVSNQTQGWWSLSSDLPFGFSRKYWMSNLSVECEETNIWQEGRLASVEDRQDRTRSSPSRWRTVRSRSGSQGCRMIRLDRF